MRGRVTLLALALLWAGTAAAAPCPPEGAATSRSGARARDCPSPRKLEPYDPDRQKGGSRPGFIDMGGGTEVRIGGRARFEAEGRR